MKIRSDSIKQNKLWTILTRKTTGLGIALWNRTHIKAPLLPVAVVAITPYSLTLTHRHALAGKIKPKSVNQNPFVLPHLAPKLNW
jgi:hypothetical protein